MTRPLIGVTGNRTLSGRVAGSLPVLADRPIEVVYVDYATAVSRAGGIPVHLVMDADPGGVLDHLDGLLLSGGADLAPALYGADPEPGLEAVEVERDAYELALLREAYERHLPILGICRGHQLLNASRGGALAQHVPEHAIHDVPAEQGSHEIAVDAGSRLAGLYGAGTCRVNSLHHQVVTEAGDSLVVTARSPDGDIEAVESADRPILGVQWHPEMYTEVDPVFTWLTEAARNYRAGRA